MFWQKFNIHVLNPLVLSFIAVLCNAVYCFMYFNNIFIAGFIAILGVPFLIQWVTFFRKHMVGFYTIAYMLNTMTLTRKVSYEWEKQIEKLIEKEESPTERMTKLNNFKNLLDINLCTISNAQIGHKQLREEFEKYRDKFLYKKIFNLYDPNMFDDVISQSLKEITLKLTDIDELLTKEINKLESEHGQKS